MVWFFAPLAIVYFTLYVVFSVLYNNTSASVEHLKKQIRPVYCVTDQQSNCVSAQDPYEACILGELNTPIWVVASKPIDFAAAENDCKPVSELPGTIPEAVHVKIASYNDLTKDK